MTLDTKRAIDQGINAVSNPQSFLELRPEFERGLREMADRPGSKVTVKISYDRPHAMSVSRDMMVVETNVPNFEVFTVDKRGESNFLPKSIFAGSNMIAADPVRSYETVLSSIAESATMHGLLKLTTPKAVAEAHHTAQLGTVTAMPPVQSLRPSEMVRKMIPRESMTKYATAYHS